MKGKKPVIFLILFLCMSFFLLGLLLNPFFGGKPKKGAEANGKTAEKYTGVAYIKGTEAGMLEAEYWKRSDGDTLLFSEDEIASFNRNNREFVLYRNEEGFERRLREAEIGERLSGQIVRSLLEEERIAQPENGGISLYVNQSKVSDSYWENLEMNRNLDAIDVGQERELRFAVCVEETVAMRAPTDDFVADSVEEFYSNDMVSSEVNIGEGVIVLHESRDGKWYYILNGSYCGWVHRETVAFCKNRAEWEKICNPERFLIVTGSKIVLDDTAVASTAAGRILRMGTKLALSDSAPDSVIGREPVGGYVVDFPAGDGEGNLFFEKVIVPVSLDVNIGYLCMTSDAVIRQAYKFLGQIYGYGGSFHSVDCSGMVRCVYSCFGMRLPRNSRAIAEMKDLGAFECEKMSSAKKLSVLSELPGGLLLYMDGHLMIYLGMKDGKPYVISACADYILSENAETVRHANCVMVSGLDLLRKNGKSWLDSVCIIDWKEY